MRRWRTEVGRCATAAFGFSFAIGLASVTLPLLALASGYSPTEVGLLAASAAAAQMVSRLALGRFMRVHPDRLLIALSMAALALCCSIAVMSTAFGALAAAQVLQGTARACFWTGSQTHVVRGEGSSVRALAVLNNVGGIGQVLGPIAAGVLASSGFDVALVIGAGAAVASLVPVSGLERLPPFTAPADRPPGALWRRPEVAPGAWAGAVAGAWRGILDSYVPIALVAARHATATVGALVAVANLASLLGGAAAARTPNDRLHGVMTAAIVATSGGIATFAVLTAWTPFVIAALMLSGLGAGALLTLSPAISSDAVHPEERGDAIAMVGTFRSAALLLAPVSTACVLTFAPLSVALALSGLLMGVPLGLRRRDKPVR